MLFSVVWVITRNLVGGFGRSLVQMNPTGLPDVFKQLRTFKNKQKAEQIEQINMFNMFCYQKHL